jgi:hypothetical protein
LQKYIEIERRQNLTSFAELAGINENIQALRYLLREISHKKGFL